MSLIKILILLITVAPDSLHAVSGWETLTSDPTVIKIEASGGTCTGTYISDEGHILTARHCIHGCLIAQGFVQETPLFPEYGWRSPKLYQQNRVAHCPVQLDGQEVEVQVLSSGPGFMIPSEQASLALYDREIHQNFLEQGFLHNGDYALLKVDSLPRNKKCRSMARQPILNGDPVHYFGYPSASTGRPQGRNSDGNQLMLAHGEVIPSILQNSCISPDTNQAGRLTQTYDRPEIILSTVDILPGSSGSSLLNEQGQVVALINSMYRQGIDVVSTYCAGSAVAVDIQTVLIGIETSAVGPIEDFHFCTNEDTRVALWNEPNRI
jgi:hypothetical protein